jgi:hypothetical protein
MFRISTASRRISYKNNGMIYHLSADILDVQPCKMCASISQTLEKEIEQVIKQTTGETVKLAKVLETHKNVFESSTTDWGTAVGVEHCISTIGPPVYVPPRRQGLVLLSVIDQVERMLKNGAIEESDSPYSSPILIVRKKDGSVRICIDFRFLNDKTIKDKFPSIKEIKDDLKGAKYFSMLDFIIGYWQIPIREKDRHKTAFTTKNGHYHFKRMAFGLTNTPPTFQRTMNNILRKVLGKYALVYLDDVNIFSKTAEEHITHIGDILYRIQKAGFKLKLSKCFFFQKSVPYLGQIISKEGSSTDPKKIELVKNFPPSENRQQLKSALGLFGYKSTLKTLEKSHILSLS